MQNSRRKFKFAKWCWHIINISVSVQLKLDFFLYTFFFFTVSDFWWWKWNVGVVEDVIFSKSWQNLSIYLEQNQSTVYTIIFVFNHRFIQQPHLISFLFRLLKLQPTMCDDYLSLIRFLFFYTRTSQKNCFNFSFLSRIIDGNVNFVHIPILFDASIFNFK